VRSRRVLNYLPFIVDSLDDEPQSRTDTIDILAHDPFHNGCLSCVIESAIESEPAMCDEVYELSYSINIRISLSFRRAFRSIESMSKLDLLRNGYFLVNCFYTLLQDKLRISITETIT